MGVLLHTMAEIVQTDRQKNRHTQKPYTVTLLSMRQRLNIIHFIVLFLYTGTGIYVQHSVSITNSAVPNNTALRYIATDWAYCYGCQISFYCLSNSTSGIFHAELIYPDMYRNSHLDINWVFSDSGLYVSNHMHHYVYDGIYTCELADANGNILNLSLGFYYNDPGM